MEIVSLIFSLLVQVFLFSIGIVLGMYFGSKLASREIRNAIGDLTLNTKLGDMQFNLDFGNKNLVANKKSKKNETE